MLKLMENEYVFHWNIVTAEPGSSDYLGYGWRCYHGGVCDGILKSYATLLECTLDEARARMHKRIGGETC